MKDVDEVVVGQLQSFAGQVGSNRIEGRQLCEVRLAGLTIGWV
jgi:hypothetical protein